MEKITTEYRIEQMLRGGFNIGSIAMAVGLTETDIIHFRAKMMDKEPKVVKTRNAVDNMTKEQLAEAIRAKVGKPLLSLTNASKATLCEVLYAVSSNRL